MKKIKNGFTLIELLVVVLIVGILAAVALPQYQVSVWRARYKQLVLRGEAIRKGETIYFLANGSYTADFSALDISVDAGTTVKLETDHSKEILYPDGYACAINLLNGNFIQCSTKRGLLYSSSFDSNIRNCMAVPDNAIFNRVCRIETGLSAPTKSDSSSNFYRYP